MPSMTPKSAMAAGQRRQVGALLLAVGLGTLTGTLSFATELGWTSVPLLAGLAIAGSSLAALVARRRASADPLSAINALREPQSSRVGR